MPHNHRDHRKRAITVFSNFFWPILILYFSGGRVEDFFVCVCLFWRWIRGYEYNLGHIPQKCVFSLFELF